jgi:hypothetical protein
VLALLNVLISWGMNSVALTFDSLKCYFIFCSTILYIYLTVELEIDEKLSRMIVILGVIISALFPISAMLMDYTKHPYLTMNFSNPNLTGMYLAEAIFYALIGFAYLKKPVAKIFCVGLLIANIVLLTWTEARNSFLAVALCFAIILWYLLLWKKRIPNYVLAVSAILPFCFMFLYLAIVDSDFFNNMFAFLVDAGKPLNSRAVIWNRVLTQLGNNVLTGNYFLLMGNAHNSHLVLLASYSAPVMLLTVIYLYHAMKRVKQRCDTGMQTLCLATFLGTLFIGLGEGALFSGGMGLYIICCTPLLLPKTISKERSEKRD